MGVTCLPEQTAATAVLAQNVAIILHYYSLRFMAFIFNQNMFYGIYLQRKRVS
jgi:hypothetical protein